MDRFDSMDRTYLKKLLFQLAMVLLIVGGLNWFIVGTFEVNVVESLFGNGVYAILIYMLVGSCQLFLSDLFLKSLMIRARY